LTERRARDAALVLKRLDPLILEVVTSEPVGELGAFNFALLVDRDDVDGVGKAIEELTDRLSPPLHFRLVGPLPPYSFVRLALPAVA
jgi:hypothetical protein